MGDWSLSRWPTLLTRTFSGTQSRLGWSLSRCLFFHILPDREHTASAGKRASNHAKLSFKEWWITGKTRQQQRFTFKLHMNSLLICKRINYNTRSMVELFLNYFVIQWEIHDIDQSPQLQIFSYFSNVMFANPKFVLLSGANPKCMTGRLSPVSKLMPHYPVKMRMWRTGGGKRCMLLWPLYTASNATRNICKIHSSP